MAEWGDREPDPSTSEPLVLVHDDAQALAASVATRLLETLAAAQRARGGASVVLTGGGIGIAVLSAVAADAAAQARIDWSAVDFWWGDERWLAPSDAERNETQGREALLDHLALDAARVHPMGADDGERTVDAAAADYAAELSRRGHPFDVVLLGVGPDAHIASLFPRHPGIRETEVSAIAVHGSPKPPPTRISLSLPAINQTRQAWLLAAGESKADAVALALSGAAPDEAPAGAVAALDRTIWFVDKAAAARWG